MRNTMAWSLIVGFVLILALSCGLKKARAARIDKVAAVEALMAE